MHSKYCPHNCLGCNSNNVIRDGLTRETAIRVCCPICSSSIYPGADLYCLVCKKTFQYTLTIGLWYIGLWIGAEYTARYRGGWWEFAQKDQ